MLPLQFFKYQSTGNDFVVADNRHGRWPAEDPALYERLCHRRLGVGADGVILLEAPQTEGSTFAMRYFNADGQLGSFCGNGGRAVVHLAHHLGLFDDRVRFDAYDGPHLAGWLGNDTVVLQMTSPKDFRALEPNAWFVHTGSPHYVRLQTSDVDETDVVMQGRMVRWHPDFAPDGTNANFVNLGPDYLKVRTFERGVEDETWSCGTGVTAAAWVYHKVFEAEFPVKVLTRGGTLTVDFKDERLWLIGPSQQVFEGFWVV